MNGKELFLSALNNETPIQWMGYGFQAFPFPYPMVLDPITELDSAFEGEYIDHWGATWRHYDTDPGAIPLVTEENKVIKDIENWREYVKFPDLENLDWSKAKAQLDAIDRNETLVMVPSYYGIFERAHALMPFEDVLVGMMEEPEIMSDLFSALTDWKIEAMRLVIDNLNPDIIHSHDDWGDSSNLFFSPDLFREVLKPHYVRFYEYINSRGVISMHHNDGYGAGLEKDLLDMGVKIWQGILPVNDIPKIRENTEGKILLMGGINQTVFDHPGFSEEDVRVEIRRAIDEYAAGGAFLPCLASVMPLNFDAFLIAIDEMNTYGAKWLEENQ